jgi:hypothetical protein
MNTNSLSELKKLLDILETDFQQIETDQLLADYILPILGSVVAEVETNRVLSSHNQTLAQISLATSQRTVAGEILSAVADHFSVILDKVEYEENTEVGNALSEIDSLLGSWITLNEYEDEMLSPSEDDDDTDDGDLDEDDADSDDDTGSDEVIDTEYAVGVVLDENGQEIPQHG